ncbi:hypothetical protein ACSSS7_002240 [Eimeria intestinalis]
MASIPGTSLTASSSSSSSSSSSGISNSINNSMSLAASAAAPTATIAASEGASLPIVVGCKLVDALATLRLSDASRESVKKLRLAYEREQQKQRRKEQQEAAEKRRIEKKREQEKAIESLPEEQRRKAQEAQEKKAAKEQRREQRQGIRRGLPPAATVWGTPKTLHATLERRPFRAPAASLSYEDLMAFSPSGVGGGPKGPPPAVLVWGLYRAGLPLLRSCRGAPGPGGPICRQRRGPLRPSPADSAGTP